MLLILGVSSPLFGASSSKDDANKSKLMLMQPKPLEKEEVGIALECLPEKLKRLEKKWNGGHVSSTCMLFYGPPGNAKTTTARALGQEHFPSRSYFFRAQAFTGNKYQNSGKETLKANLLPIIKKASKEKQCIVIDEFHQFIKKKKNDSRHLRNLATYFWQMIDEMMDTGNIVLIGTCNKIDKLPAPVASRFSESRRYEFKRAPLLLYERLLSLYLPRADFPHSITDEADIRDLAQRFNCEVRKVAQLVEDASEIAYNRGDQNTVITKADMLQALQEYREARDDQGESWGKWLKKHERKIYIGAAVAGVALTATGLYLSYQQKQDQIKWRNQDIIKQKDQRTADLDRQQKFHNQQIEQQKKFHEQQIEQQNKLYEQQKHDQQVEKADKWPLPNKLNLNWHAATLEVKRDVAEQQARRMASIKESVHEAGVSIKNNAPNATTAAAIIGEALVSQGGMYPTVVSRCPGCEIL